MKITEKVRTLKASLSDKAKVRKQLRGPAHLSYVIADSITMLDSPAWKMATAHAGFFCLMTIWPGLKAYYRPISRHAMHSFLITMMVVVNWLQRSTCRLLN